MLIYPNAWMDQIAMLWYNQEYIIKVFRKSVEHTLIPPNTLSSVAGQHI